MSHQIPEDADYATVRTLLILRVNRNREARHPFAAIDERVLQEHDTRQHERGAACDACGRPWPCGTALSVLAPE